MTNQSCEKSNFNLFINPEVLKMFRLAIELKQDDETKYMERVMRSYVSKAFAETSKAYGDDLQDDIEVRVSYYGKATDKIAKWARSKDMVAHKIIKAFLKLEEDLGAVYTHDLEAKCSKKELGNMFVEQFTTNFNQLKYDTYRSYGKVFDVNYETNEVTIWDDVREKIDEYKDEFMN